MVIKCSVCNKDFYIRPSDVKRGRSCCSRKCGRIKRILPSGSNHANWKGSTVGYEGLHRFIRAHKPQPIQCECCGKLTKQLDLANISQKYLRDINDFEYLCRSCHMNKDNRIQMAKDNLINGTKTRWNNKKLYSSEFPFRKL